MRLVVFFCGILILANVVLMLMPVAESHAPHVYKAREDFNPHFIRMNKEIEEKYLVSSPTPQAAHTSSHSGLGQECYRLGPFLHQSNFDLAQAALVDKKIAYTKSIRESKASDAYRVYIGPYPSQAEALDVRTELKRKNLLDHFVKKRGQGDYIVSLGLFSTMEFANNAVSLLEDKLATVKMKKEKLELPESYWLYFSIPASSEVYRQLASTQWGGVSTKLGKLPCQFNQEKS